MTKGPQLSILGWIQVPGENGLLQVRTIGAESCPREGLDSYSASLLAWRSSKQEVNRKFIDRKQELESPSSSRHLSSIPSSGRFYWMKFAESCLQLCRAEGKGQDAVLRPEVDNQHSKDHSCLRPTSQIHRETLLSYDYMTQSLFTFQNIGEITMIN